MGKYTVVSSNLPPLQPTDKSYQDKVEEHKATLSTFTPKAILKLYVKQRKVRNKAKDNLGQANLELEAISQLLIEQFEAEGIESKKLETGESLSVHPEPYPVINNNEVFRLWCVKEGLERLMKLPWQSTSAIVKERLLNGEAEPPGVTTYSKQKISFRKGQNAQG